MKKVKILYEQLLPNKREPIPFKKKHPQYDEKDGKTHLLFIAPCLNGSGYYRAILPTLELNQTSGHCAIITEMPKWNFNKRLMDYVTPVDQRLIKWADYIVFSSIEEDLSYLIQGWKAQNKDLQFVMDLDNNIHAMPRQHLHFSKITPEDKKQLLNNIARMDLLTGASEGLLDYYENLIEKYHPSSEVMMGYLPNLISSFGYEELSPLKKNNGDKIRIGIIGSGANGYEVSSILPVLKQVNKKYEDQVELILFGWNGKLSEGKEGLEDVKFTYHKSVRFIDYFETLNQLALDIALIPSQKILFNTHGKSFIKYLEFSVLGIPVIAANNKPYLGVIEQGETGFLASNFEEWMEAIDRLVNDSELRNSMGKNALKQAWSKYSYTRENLRHYQEVFRSI